MLIYFFSSVGILTSSICIFTLSFGLEFKLFGTVVLTYTSFDLNLKLFEVGEGKEGSIFFSAFVILNAFIGLIP